jgi:hypothetical protein
MVRERALLDQHPQFLWPSSSVLVEVARSSGLKLSRDQVIFTSPIVLYSWDRIADGLVRGGFAQPAGGPRYTIDLEKLLRAQSSPARAGLRSEFRISSDARASSRPILPNPIRVSCLPVSRRTCSAAMW